MIRKYHLYVIILLTLLGFSDSAYLTYQHYNNAIPPCHTGIFSDCGKVLQSKWSEFFGIPVAFFGVIIYFFELVCAILIYIKNKGLYKKILQFLAFVGVTGSVYFMFLQFFVIRSLCLYCTLSAFLSLLIFIFSWKYFNKSRKNITTTLSAFFYRSILKKILFRLNAEIVHESIVDFGWYLSKLGPVRKLFSFLFLIEDKRLKQQILNISFENPIGLSAGFDYDAKLTQILPSLSFGFMSVGTITNGKYDGNPSPRLGRLIKSRSLMVNKGFKTIGVDAIIEKLSPLNFSIPVGISIGRTNSAHLNTQKKSVNDIVTSFKKLEKAKLKNAYYELNISCPNLIHAGSIDFYEPEKLDELLTLLDAIKIKKPIFVKMPIDKNNKETEGMLNVIDKHKIAGVIFGNLQKNRDHASLVPEEVARFKVGNFSGKPTWQRSNELISLTYQKYNKRFVIIGSGGVFGSDDAYEKIKRGASLVQLITGMIFEGPQLISRINLELVELLKKDGFSNISEAVGSYNR